MINIPTEIISSVITPIILSKVGKTIAKKVIAKSAEEIVEQTLLQPKPSPITPILFSLPNIISRKKEEPKPNIVIPQKLTQPKQLSNERICSVLSYTYGITKDKRILQTMIDKGCITEEEAKDLETLE